jgi:hypothetical protein
MASVATLEIKVDASGAISSMRKVRDELSGVTQSAAQVSTPIRTATGDMGRFGDAANNAAQVFGVGMNRGLLMASRSFGEAARGLRAYYTETSRATQGASLLATAQLRLAATGAAADKAIAAAGGVIGLGFVAAVLAAKLILDRFTASYEKATEAAEANIELQERLTKRLITQNEITGELGQAMESLARQRAAFARGGVDALDVQKREEESLQRTRAALESLDVELKKVNDAELARHTLFPRVYAQNKLLIEGEHALGRAYEILRDRIEAARKAAAELAKERAAENARIGAAATEHAWNLGPTGAVELRQAAEAAEALRAELAASHGELQYITDKDLPLVVGFIDEATTATARWRSQAELARDTFVRIGMAVTDAVDAAAGLGGVLSSTVGGAVQGGVLGAFLGFLSGGFAAALQPSHGPIATVSEADASANARERERMAMLAANQEIMRRIEIEQQFLDWSIEARVAQADGNDTLAMYYQLLAQHQRELTAAQQAGLDTTALLALQMRELDAVLFELHGTALDMMRDLAALLGLFNPDKNKGLPGGRTGETLTPGDPFRKLGGPVDGPRVSPEEQERIDRARREEEERLERERASGLPGSGGVSSASASLVTTRSGIATVTEVTGNRILGVLTTSLSVHRQALAALQRMAGRGGMTVAEAVDSSAVLAGDVAVT